MLQDIRKRIEQAFSESVRTGKQNTVPGFEKADAYGHEAGAPIERWVKTSLENIDWGDWHIGVYFPNEFLQTVFSRIGRNKDRIVEALNSTWWGPLIVSKKQIGRFVEGHAVDRWQQEGADIVVSYGADVLEDINDVVLINAKSHDVERASRPPNIMSAQRLLEYFAFILERKDLLKLLEKVNLWFLGVDYSVEDNKATVSDVHIKDLFSLHLAKLPQINFDAAIQIQWHVRDMVEKSQDKLAFMKELAETFMKQWKSHSGRKEEKYEKLVRRIKKLAGGVKKQQLVS